MRFNEFKPLLEYKVRASPPSRKPTRAAKPVTTAPAAQTQASANPFASMASNLTTQSNTQAAPAAPTQTSTSTGGAAQTVTNPDGTTTTKHIANPNNPNITKPSLLNRIGNSLTKALDFSTQGRVDSQAQKIFIDKFNKTMDYNIQSAQQQGMKFNLKGFVDGYMAKNHWKPGQLQSQLDQAVATNNRKNIAATMAQIGKANTAMHSPTREPEIAGAFGDAPTQAVPTQTEPPQAPPERPAPPLVFGGKTIDPSTPLYAKVLSMMKQQGVA